ncbi:MAG: NADH:ubiquinone reductase (Na(+)-transporting) subunit F [Chlamydiales bacterium]|nr:NADH:ubiquinone reductase (Na(+)-transporting) subunit F [Chlamydiales bacterium]
MFGIDISLMVYAVAAFVIIGVGLAGMILFTKAKLVTTEDAKIYINDDPNLTKTVQGGQTLLSALTTSGIPVPSPCGGKATCKQCRVRIVEGASPPLETDKGTFTTKELKEGWRLSCQCKVRHDLAIVVDSHALSVEKFEGTVIKNENVATFIKELTVEAPLDIPYRAGGYLQFHVPPFKTNTADWKESMDPVYYPDWERFQMFGREVDYSGMKEEVIRAYSMASYPAEGRKLMFNIRIATPPLIAGKLSDTIPWGICSAYTFGLKPGDKVTLSGPYGESFMINDDRELVFLIGGAGSSFGRAHILHLLKTENTKRKITLWYGARSLKENIYQDEYEELARLYPNFTYNLVLSEPLPDDIEKGWPKTDPIKTAFLFKAFELGQLKKMEEPEECLYYVCGPPLHNKSVMKLLDDYGVPRESIILDDFGN